LDKLNEPAEESKKIAEKPKKYEANSGRIRINYSGDKIL
jgi:hypothetical protein